MSANLDASLVFLARREVRKGELTPELAIAINLLWRRKVPALRLAKVFGVSPNTIYYRCLTGKARSYKRHTPRAAKSAIETNRAIDQMGFDRAWDKYVTQEMVDAVHGELKAQIRRRRA